jgi:diguanylate cyclase (GGDEF)-like protein/PAS domain S-box-containing protein
MQAAIEGHAGEKGNAPGRRGHLTVEALVLAAALLTWVASYNRESLTHLEQVYKPQDNETAFASYQYDDRTEGGTSSVYVNEGRALSWTCDLEKTYEYGYCGFGIIFDQYHTGRGLDLSDYDSVSFTLRYEGSGQSLRLVLKDLDPRYSELGAPNNEKIDQANIPISAGVQAVSLNLVQFSVAEWWHQAAANPSVELSRPSFNNISSLEILTATDSEAGRHSLSIDRITFHGQAMSAETWYGGIALAWFLLIGAILAQRRREVEKWRRRFVESMETTIDTIPHMVWSLDADGKASFNKRWEDFTGVPLGDCGWRNLRQLVHRDDALAAIRQWKEGLCCRSGFNIQLRLLHHSGAFRWVLAHAVPSFDRQGALNGWYGTCTDVHDRVLAEQALRSSITKERKRSQQLKWSSEHDSLTRLPNRRAFEARLEQALMEANSERSHVGLLLVDIDYFKHTNDTLGHDAGDELLKAISSRLKRSIRRQDFVARIGGDEFAIVLPDLLSEADLAKVGQEVSSAIQHALNIGGHVVRPSASIGGTLCPKEAAESSDFLKRADAALYALKRSGRGGFRMFESYMLEDVKSAAFQLARAREAIEDGSIIAVYQPKISVEEGSITGFEALLRLRTQDGALELPDMLAEAFNDYELAAKIGEAMQNRVARDIRSWIDSGIRFGRVSINAAPAEFLRNDYAERLLQVLACHDVPPSCVEVEVTEHAFVELGWEYVARALDQLDLAGVAISLDDFGTGHSSLSHIRDFPVDMIKIDLSYTKQITDDDAIAALVTGLVHLACSLGLEVVAEGVETREQLELLRKMGCHYAQGHLLGYPMESTIVGQYLADRTIENRDPIAASRAA